MSDDLTARVTARLTDALNGTILSQHVERAVAASLAVFLPELQDAERRHDEMARAHAASFSALHQITTAVLDTGELDDYHVAADRVCARHADAERRLREAEAETVKLKADYDSLLTSWADARERLANLRQSCDDRGVALEKAEAQALNLRRALTATAEWLESFSMPPTSTIQEKNDALSAIDAALADPQAQGRAVPPKGGL
jgi:chromosome segregation ATPase